MTQKPIDEDGVDLDVTARSPAASPAAAGFAEMFTPGPWRTTGLNGGFVETFEERDGETLTGLYVADCSMLDNGASNARLIAAAPDLYEALKAMVATFGNTRRDEWLNDEAFRDAKLLESQARASLAKASPSADGAQANSAERVNPDPHDTSVLVGEKARSALSLQGGENDG